MNNEKGTAFDIALMILAFVVCVTFALPMFWLFSASFQSYPAICSYPFHWIPQEWFFSNYIAAWQRANIAGALCSSFIVSISYIILHVIFCSSSGYVFAKYKFRFKSLIFMLILGTMMIPQEVTFITTYDVVNKMHLIDTYPGIFIPLCMSGFGIYLMKNTAASIPDELLESAKIDGCGNVRTLWNIAIPSMKPGISALTILAFSYVWNEYAWSNLVINSKELRTVPITLALLSYSALNDILTNVLVAGCVMSLIPVLIIFVVFQKQFMESLVHSGIKG